jgi:FdhD protein
VAGAPRVAAAVLAGGGSTRMGRDKAAVEVDGRPLLDRTVTTLRSVAGVVGPVLVVGGDEHGPPGSPDARGPERTGWSAGATAPDRVHVVDAEPGAGPLAGLATALAAAPEHAADPDLVLVTGVDHPWLVAEVLDLLVARAHLASDEVLATMLVSDRGPQPLLAAYRPAARTVVDAAVAAGERRLRVVPDLLVHQAIEPTVWRRHDAAGLTAVDVDTPGELADAETWVRRVVATRGTSAPVGADVPKVAVRRVRSGSVTDHLDVLIGEEPLEVRAAGPGQDPVTVVTTLRTPGHERELAVGWLLAEGLATPDDIVEVELGDAVALARPDDQVTVRLRRAVDPALVAHRHAAATASCGVCGRASIDELATRIEVVSGDAFSAAPLPWSVLARLPDELRLAQPRFGATGGVHATGLFDRAGRLVTVREDVGRHNALDAAIGAHVLGRVWSDDEVGLADLVCVLSGRIGFELVAKAAAARLPIVAAVGAASDLAVRTADRLGITLVGFLRRGDGTVYTHAHRVQLST